MTTLRDLLPPLPGTPTLQEMASGAATTPLVEITDYERELVAVLPGDDVSRHPKHVDSSNNRFWGMGPQQVLRMLKDGSIPDQAGRKQASDWLAMCGRCGVNIKESRG